MFAGDVQGPPQLGSNWMPTVDHTSFHPGYLIDYLYLEEPLAVAECDARGIRYVPTTAAPYFAPAGTQLSVPIPNNFSLLGQTLTAQVLSFTSAIVH